MGTGGLIPAGTGVAEAILSTYNSRLDTLPNKDRVHFLRRAYRLTGDLAYTTPLEEWAHRHTVPAVRRRAAQLRAVTGDGAAYPSVKFRRSRNARVNARNDFLTQHPELQFFRRYSMDLFQAYSSGLQDTELRGEWETYIGDLKKINFDRMYVDLDVVRTVSSFAVNTVIFWKFLGVDEDLHRRFVGYLRGVYLNDDLSLAHPLSDQDFTSLVYNMTHVVIAYSAFYQKWVNDHRWIADFFVKYLDRIIARCSFDVIAEVGLSLRLLKLEDRWATEFETILKHIRSNYDFDRALTTANLKRYEHTNAVIMLLFSENEFWHPGPLLTGGNEG